MAADGEDPAEGSCRRVQAALFLESEAEIVVDARVVGARLQNAAVDALRLGQPPGSMVSECLLQRDFELLHREIPCLASFSYRA